MTGTDILFGRVGFLAVEGGVDAMVAKTLFSEELAMTMWTMVARQSVR